MAIVALLGARLNRLLYDWRGKTLQPYSFAEVAGIVQPAEPHSIEDGTVTDEAEEKDEITQ